MLKRQKYRMCVIKSIYPFTKGVRKYFIFNIFCSIFLMLTALIVPVLYKLFIEETLLNKNIKVFAFVVCGYIVIQLVNTIISFLKYICTYTVNNKISKSIRLKILDAKLKMDFSEYSKLNIGNEKMILDDAVFKLLDFTETQSIDYLINQIKTIVLGISLIIMEWQMALLMFMMIPITYLINNHNAKLSKENNNLLWINNEVWSNWIYDSSVSWREIRALRMEDKCQNIFDKCSDVYQNLFRRCNQLWVTRHFIIPKIKDEFLMQFIMYFLGGLAIYYGYISIGTLLIFAQYYNQLTESLQTVVSTDNDLQINTISYDKALDAIKFADKLEIKKSVIINDYKIELNNVSFRYNESDNYILKDFSLVINPGDKIGIVGESGRGKTTLLKLMIGLVKPTEGNVCFGGYNIEDINIIDVHKKIGVVFQNNNLFNTTIKENLLYAKEDASDEEISEACKKACIDDFIDSLPDKYETVVGERGIKLSGGQKQRIVLARLFLLDVDVFILDEATSAMDQYSECLIQDSIESCGKEKTVICFLQPLFV